MKRRMIEGFTAMLLTLGIAGVVSAVDDATAAPAEDDVIEVRTVQVTDMSDDRKLVGVAHDVFTGTVVRQRATTTVGGVPESHFDVEVLHPVKGSLSGTVVVNQLGGVTGDGMTVRIDGDALLETGRTYLFATRTDDKTRSHTLIPGYGDLPVESAMASAGLLERFSIAEATEITVPLDG